MLSTSTDAGASLNVQGPGTISQQTGSGLYSQYYKYLTHSILLGPKLKLKLNGVTFERFTSFDVPFSNYFRPKSITDKDCGVYTQLKSRWTLVILKS